MLNAKLPLLDSPVKKNLDDKGEIRIVIRSYGPNQNINVNMTN